MLNEFTNTRCIFNLLVPGRICDYRMKERSENNLARSHERDPQVRANRPGVFYKEAEPMLLSYPPYIIKDIDGTGSMEYVSKKILDTLCYAKFINEK